MHAGSRCFAREGDQSSGLLTHKDFCIHYAANEAGTAVGGHTEQDRGHKDLNLGTPPCFIPEPSASCRSGAPSFVNGAE